MSDFNPYAYTEESEIVIPRSPGSQTGEPALPLEMTVFLKTGFLSSTPCQLSVTEEQMEFSAMRLQEPVTVQRLTARGQVKLRLLDMKIRGDNGRKYRMKYPKADPEKHLTLARLETWLNPDLADDPDAAQQRVDNRLKKWVCSMVTHYISFLLALQVIALILLSVVWVVALAVDRPNWDAEDTVMSAIKLGFVVMLVASNATILILLRFGQMWVLYFAIMLYSLFCLIALVNLSILAAVLGGAVIYYSVKAMGDYKRLSPQIDGIMV